MNSNLFISGDHNGKTFGKITFSDGSVFCGLEYDCKTTTIGFSHGGTLLTCNVCGPEHSEEGNIEGIVEVTFDHYYKNNLAYVPAWEFIESLCNSVLDANCYVETIVKVNISVIQDDRNLLAAATNAICLAFIKTGLYMRFIFAAATCIITENDDILVLPQELPSNIPVKGTVTMVFQKNSGDDILACICNFGSNGYKNHLMSKCTKLCYENCKQKFQEYSQMTKDCNNSTAFKNKKHGSGQNKTS